MDRKVVDRKVVDRKVLKPRTPYDEFHTKDLRINLKRSACVVTKYIVKRTVLQ